MQQFGDEKPVNVTVCRDFHRLSIPACGIELYSQTLENTGKICAYVITTWMRQWESQELGEQGYSAIQILRRFYGQDMYINTAEEISGIPASWPGYDLDIGASGQKVRQLQEQLNTIAEVYSSLPRVEINGYYDEDTREAVMAFQRLFNLPVSGIVDYPTWYKIHAIYVAVTRIAELN